MSKHNDLGNKAEILASNFLVSKGFEVLHKNWRSHHLEIDIICKDKEEVVFVEVKARSATGFGYPEEFIDDMKRKNLIKAANEYLKEIDTIVPSRFDIVSILMKNSEEVMEIIHFEDAFYE